MTRTTLQRKLRWITFWLVAVLLVAFAAKLFEIRGNFGFDSKYAEFGKAFYEFLKDMAVVIVTIAAVYLAAVLQRRSKFIESLEEEWRSIVRTKSELFAYCEMEKPSPDDYLRAFCRISETIDTMRIVYRNVGETDRLVGLYPYVPLHDMRRALQVLDPDLPSGPPGEQQRKLVRDAILQCFYALRETFLEELDLEEPVRPLVVAASQRLKQSGATSAAAEIHADQLRLQDGMPRARPEIDALLQDALLRERTKAQQRTSRKGEDGQ